jgi:hypothetical protein
MLWKHVREWRYRSTYSSFNTRCSWEVELKPLQLLHPLRPDLIEFEAEYTQIRLNGRKSTPRFDWIGGRIHPDSIEWKAEYAQIRLNVKQNIPTLDWMGDRVHPDSIELEAEYTQIRLNWRQNTPRFDWMEGRVRPYSIEREAVEERSLASAWNRTKILQ